MPIRSARAGWAEAALVAEAGEATGEAHREAVELERIAAKGRGLRLRLADETGEFAPFTGRRAAGAPRLSSWISDDPLLAREAERAGRSVQAEFDRLRAQLAQGNLNPGIGNRSLFGGVIEARSRGGARLYFRHTSDGIEILAKSSKANQGRVISRLEQLYGGD